MLATLGRGDTVLVPDPSYPIHMYGAVIAGTQIRSVPITPERDFFADLEQAIRGSYPKPKMIVLGFPSNPTAQCVELGFFERLIALARKHDILVVHDLAYADIAELVNALARIKSYHDYGTFTFVWARIPEAYRALGSLEFAKRMLEQAKVCVAPGIGFGDYGDEHVRLALIENENRIRQAVRGIRAMLRGAPAARRAAS